MKTLRAWPTLALVAMLMLAGCSAQRTVGTGPNPPASATATPSTPPASGGATPISTPSEPEHRDGETKEKDHDESEHEGSVTATYSKENPPPDTFRRADTGESTSGSGRVPLEMRTKPGCGEVGGTIEITVRTKPNIEVTILPTVPREDGKMGTVSGRSGPDGLWQYTLSLPRRMTPGNYDVMAAAADDHGDDGGRSGSWLIVVAEPGGCR